MRLPNSPDPGKRFDSTSARSAAISLAQRGIPVWRIAAGSKNLHVDKDWNEGGAVTDPLAVFDRFSGGNYNIGCWMGDGRHITIDIDDPDAWSAWLAEHGTVPETFTVETPGGGRHLYFKTDDGERFGQADLVKGVNVRALGGYVVGPGSTFQGRPYRILNDAPIASLPDNLRQRLRARGERSATGPAIVSELDTPGAIEHARARLAWAAPAIEGQGGDNSTFRLAAELLGLGLTVDTCVELLRELWDPRCEPPWGDELRTKVENAWQYRQSPIGRDNPEAGFEALPAAKLTRSLAEITEKSVQWFWHPYIPGGCITLLAGRGGAGKGLVATSLAAAVTCGEAFPAGGERAPRGNVLWCEAEDPLEEVVKPRFVAAGAHVERVETITPDLWPQLDLKSYVRGMQTRLIVMSPIVSFLKGLEDINSEIKVRKVLENIQAAVEGTGCAVLGLAHVNKKADLAAVERVLGSVAFTNFVRAVIFAVKEDPEAGTGRFVHGKWNISTKGRDLIYQAECIDENRRGQRVRLAWSLSDTDVDAEAIYDRKKKGDKRKSAASWLVEYLLVHGETPREAIVAAAGEAGYSEDAIRQAQQRSGCKSRSEGSPPKYFWSIP